jgi:hypothetical protein
MNRRKIVVLALAATGLVATTSVALADNVVGSVEGSQAVTIVAGSSGTASVKVVSTNGSKDEQGCNIDAGETLVLSFTGPSGVTVPDLTVAACDVFYPITITASAHAVSGEVTAAITTNTTGEGDYNVNVRIPVTVTPVVVTPGGDENPPDTDGDGLADELDNCDIVANPDQADADADGLGDACDSNAFVPTVLTAASGGTGTEGDTLTVSGAFADADAGTVLELTADNSAGDFTDNGDGTWTWTLPTTDDVAATSVIVTAADGEHQVTDTFTYSAINAAPVISAVTQQRGGPCTVTLGAPFTDAGSNDTHTTSVLWSDGGTDLTHTFASAGTYTADVTVTDDDGGADTETATDLRGFNTPSGLLAPITTAGTRSAFKVGSTIPVKVTVTGCDGAAVTTLTPSVQVGVGAAVDPAAVREVATNGKGMTWDGAQYVYNLSTKLSTQGSAALGQGTYAVEVSDSSFEAPVSATLDLRK